MPMIVLEKRWAPAVRSNGTGVIVKLLLFNSLVSMYRNASSDKTHFGL
jgi:hypothetical protein